MFELYDPNLSALRFRFLIANVAGKDDDNKRGLWQYGFNESFCSHQSASKEEL